MPGERGISTWKPRYVIADVVNVQADDAYLDPETGAFDMQRADLLAYSHGKYYGLGELIGKFGWSVKKKK